MKIVLIAPAGAMHRYNGSFARSLHYAPLTLTTLAALVPPELDAEIQIIDETVENIPANISADIIGITVITGTSKRCYKWADYFRSKGICVILGGVHVTLMPHEAQQHADAIVTGFAEDSWPELLNDFHLGKLKPKYQMNHSENGLAGRPRPRRDLLKKRAYITTNSVEAIRGCRHKCNFCVIPPAFSGNVWEKDIRDLIAEIDALPGRDVIFVDVNMITSVSFAKEFFRELASLKKRWFGLVTSLIFQNEELFSLMTKSGCKGLLIGFESVTDNSLKAVNKGFQKVADYELLVKKLHDAGVAINGTFVFGNDADDLSVFEKTVERIQKLKIDLPRYSIYTAFPGTPLYNQMKEQNRIIENDWSLYDVQHCVVKPKLMSPDELNEGLLWAWNETYKTASVLSRIAGIHSRFLLDMPLNLGYRLYAKKLSQFTPQVMMDNSDVPQ